MKLLLFPNNIFEKSYLPDNIDTIYLIEDPIFFGFREKRLNFNKLKLILHVASMKFYQDYLIKNGYKVIYISYSKNNYNKIKEKELTCFEIVDHLLLKRVKQHFQIINFIQNPNFLLSQAQLEKYNRKKPTHSSFYIYVKNELSILKGEKTFDMENRKKIPVGTKVPPLPSVIENKFVNEAIQYVNKKFPKNNGNTDNFIYPITFEDSKKWFHNFIQKRYPNFGEYQDAIVMNETFLFHSVISPMFNIGLLNPDYIVAELTKHRGKMNNYEGFLRQVIGWREYQRYCYLYHYEEMKNSNIFQNKNKLNKKWYDGTLGILPIDDTIKTAFKYGYLHHILRLMVMTNFMNLCEIHPDDVYKWFMEFSVDSYDWVMVQNVYSMGMWSDGGLTMRKPYISTDNYILNMSNYSKKNEWGEIWKSLYYNFLEKHEQILLKTPYGRNLANWNKKSKKEKNEILIIGKNFLKSIK
jgi:deoxyribodipyrimidine photolyase-related protein